ncbi:MAG TPA: hypothetical protein PK286_13350 [Devosia sp.]|nr:hypothetical protein [Devosia sp.]
MSIELTSEQNALKRKITTTAVLWAVIAALIAGLLVFWAAANAPDWVRWLLTVIVLALAGYLTFKLAYNSGVAKSVCKKCGTAFGIHEVERLEHVLSVEQKRKVSVGRKPKDGDPGTNRVTTWTQEKVEITAVDECFNCRDRTERKWTVDRDGEKTETEVPA